jgi:hypothetical protein
MGGGSGLTFQDARTQGANAMDFFKALIPGVVLTLVVSGVVGGQHSKGGWLNIEHHIIHGQGFYWSWILFVIATGLAWMLFTITPK